MNLFLSKLFNKLVTRPILKMKLKYVGTNFRFGHSSIFNMPSSFCIGDNFFSGPYTYFSSNKHTPINIGDNVMFGPYCKVIGGNHNITEVSTTMMDAPFLGGGKGIVIENDVWIGAGSTILDGARIREGVVLGAGIVISNDTVPYCVYGGVPAKLIRKRFSVEDIEKVNSQHYTTNELINLYSNIESGL